MTTRRHDNDAYGHVNNAVCYGWFDTAVNAWLIAAGLLDAATGDPIGLVVETGCRYARPLAFPQPVEVGLAIARIGTSRVRYQLGIFASGEAEAAAEGHFTHVYVGRHGRRPTPLRRSMARERRANGRFPPPSSRSVASARWRRRNRSRCTGGIGMTWELPLSHLAKRLTMIGPRLGDEDHHLERYVALAG